MVPSRAVTLFADKPEPGPSPATFVLSVFVHSMALALIWFGLVYKPPFARVTNDHLMVRQIDLRTPEEERAAAAHIPYPAAAPAARQPASNSRPRLPVLQQMTQAKPGPQTILQPDLLNTTALSEKIPVPQLMIWSPSKSVVKKVEPPMPQKPPAADVKPVVSRPNLESNLADVNVSAAIEPAQKSLFKPSTTSPVAVHVPQAAQMPPASASQSTQPPTPAAILSLSNMRAKEGTTVLPPVNESEAANSPGVLAPGEQNAASSQNGAAPAAQSASNSAGQGSATKADNSNSGPAAEAGKPNASTSATGAGTSTADASASPSSTQIALPKDGHFGSVVVGEGLDQKFPEISGVWGSRLAYTAYLHVGLAKSWILQYSLPPATDASAGGTVARLEAPWPYSIVRPNLPPGSIDADALMIHGFVNQSGRFETLTVVFPQQFAQTQFVLAALQQWQFRPATQAGQSAKVEILLIIPEDLD